MHIDWNGRAKAQAIRQALNHAIDEALKYEIDKNNSCKRFANFDDFKKFSLTTGDILFFEKQQASLEETLSIHRFEEIDKLLNIEIPNSNLKPKQ